ncbi:MAG: aldehyde dehydrogenase family protein [Cellulosilyticum sp.]|nr:aldehyde dehydrogenase family protein [Cellulosilyticum sp.]
MNNTHEMVQKMNRFFYTRQTYDIKKRIQILKKLRKSIITHHKAIIDALYSDFQKPTLEAYSTEIYTTLSELNEAIKYVSSWAKPDIKAAPLPLLGGHHRILKEPYGVCVIYSPYNYPFQLAMCPLIGAIAAGNCAIIKPSEYTPATNKILKQIIRETFPPFYVQVVEGDAKIAAKLLEEPIDYIFFTGGIETGKKVMYSAAHNLIPVTLELGGKSPTIVDYDANLKLAAKRIVWGKFLNAGQTCVAPDYVLVHESVAQSFLRHIKSELTQLYNGPHQMAHIINESQYVRLLQLINEDKIYCGGHFDTDTLYIEPTVLYPVHQSDLCMQEEIFGPILPIIPFKCLSEAIQIVQRQPKPLACYLFGNDKKRINHLLKHISFGGGCINDTILHLVSPKVPFGGVGYSGMGAYHGYDSFKTFTHQKTVLVSSSKEIPIRYFNLEKLPHTIRKWMR